MSVSKRYLPIAIACLFAGSTGMAMAGSQSALDPDSYPKTNSSGLSGSGTHADSAPTQTYVTMPAPEGKSKLPKLPKPKISLPKLPKIGMHKDKKDKPQPMMAELKPANEHPAIEHKDKATTTKVAKDSKGSGNGIIDKTKSFGQSIASGAKSFSSKIGSGFKSAGEKMKDGTESVGSKVAKLSPFGHGKDKDSSKIATGNKLPLGNRMSTGQSIATGGSMETRNSKVAGKMATGKSRVAGKSAAAGSIPTGKQVATDLPIKTTFGQVSGDSWNSSVKSIQNSQAVKAANAPNKTTGKAAGGDHHGFFGKFAKLPFTGHDKKQIAGNGTQPKSPQGPQM